jgi:predicted DNA-binding transcriptional regulator AlpA
MHEAPTTILPKLTVRQRLGGISDTTLWRLERRGDFPRSIKISPGRVGYRESEVEAWIARRAEDAR